MIHPLLRSPVVRGRACVAGALWFGRYFVIWRSTPSLKAGDVSHAGIFGIGSLPIMK
jgi:hypothetical protein